MRWFILAIIVGLVLAPFIALAEDAPCKANGDTVTCQRAGFDVLVRRYIDADADAKACAIKLDAMTRDRDDLQRRLDDVLAKPAPKPAPTPAPDSLRPGFAFVLGVAGGVAIALAPTLTDLPLSARAALGVGGVAAIMGGFWMVVPR